MNRRKHKKQNKRAFWMRISAFDAFGGDYITWQVHGNPTVEIVCSNCHECIPMVRGKEESFDFAKYALFKKKCPNCRYKMR